jgi:uncharacterized repeat protein (TIGR03803 family)
MCNLSWLKKACALSVLCVAMASAAHAQVFTTLNSLDGTDGAYPEAGLIQASNGNLYGTASQGGASTYGTVFEITRNGTLSALYSFDLTDGGLPYAGLIQASNESLYGTTFEGGANACPSFYFTGCGTVFKINLSGTLTTLDSFDGTDGAGSEAGLVQGADGDLYGTAADGTNGYGTVFKITPTGTLTTLYNFCAKTDCADGAYPLAGLVQGTDGNLYGTTEEGGNSTNCGTAGCGTVFKITTSGELTTFHSFDFGDGASPFAGLIQAVNGNFYGTTSGGGANAYGTVFEITKSGTLTTLHSFDSTDGAYAVAGLVQGTDGNFYGTTAQGGNLHLCTDGCGTLFQLTPQGTLTTLYSFCSKDEGGRCEDGGVAYSALFQATDGLFYGTTYFGGPSPNCDNGCGTVFSLDMGLGPFVSFVRNPARVGQAFGILGQRLKGTTSVSLNGIPASFTVKSDTLIEATVPAGATTGYLTVTTPSGMLTSNVPFHVIN